MEYPIIKQVGRLEFELAVDWATEYGVIKKGFKTNLGSIPRLLWWVVNPAADTAAFTLHDWLYCKKCISRLEADLKLYKLLEANDNVSNLVAYLAFIAVRIGGGCYWRSAE